MVWLLLSSSFIAVFFHFPSLVIASFCSFEYLAAECPEGFRKQSKGMITVVFLLLAHLWWPFSLSMSQEPSRSGHSFSGSLGLPPPTANTLPTCVCLLGYDLYFFCGLHICLCFGAPDHHSWHVCIPWKGLTYEMHLDFLIFKLNTTEAIPSSSLEPHFDLCLGYRNLVCPSKPS